MSVIRTWKATSTLSGFNKEEGLKEGFSLALFVEARRKAGLFSVLNQNAKWLPGHFGQPGRQILSTAVLD